MNPTFVSAKKMIANFCLYLEHLIAGLAIGFALYALLLLGLFMAVPDGPRSPLWETKTNLELVGLALPFACSIVALLRAYRQPIAALNSWIGLTIITSILVYSLIGTAVLLFFEMLQCMPKGFC